MTTVITGNASRVLGLGDQIRQYAKVVGRRVDHVHRNLSIMLFTGILYGTPVDTGAARGGWYTSKNFPIMGGTGRLSPDGRLVTDEIKTVCMSAKFNEILFFVNTVEYIVPLEYGHSQRQAPRGMVRINVARVKRMVREVIASAREVR
jgi:hypothetical protein